HQPSSLTLSRFLHTDSLSELLGRFDADRTRLIRVLRGRRGGGRSDVNIAGYVERVVQIDGEIEPGSVVGRSESEIGDVVCMLNSIRGRRRRPEVRCGIPVIRPIGTYP